MSVTQNDRWREVLAQEAAKIIITEGVRDYQQAKRKACARLGNSLHGSLPSNYEIERAISSFHKTFVLEHAAVLTELRKIALAIMHWLQEFSPYLVGPVLEGTANANTPISLHVCCDAIEAVIEVLHQRDMALKIEERRFKFSKEFKCLPTLLFCYQDCEIAVTVFTLRQQHQFPKNKTQNRGMQRINTKQLTTLLQQC